MKESQDIKNRLGIAGEYRVLSELLLMGFDASITMGNSKGTDIIIVKKDKSYTRLEVKTSKNGRNFVTSYFPKYSVKSDTDPDFWVFFHPKIFSKNGEDKFFILSHREVRVLQLKVNKGRETEKGQGVDNIPYAHLQLLNDSMDNWKKIN